MPHPLEMANPPVGPETIPASRWRKLLLLVNTSLALAFGVWLGWADWPQAPASVLPSPADAIVVLGGGAAERPRQAWHLYEELRAPILIVTGDGGSIVRSLRGYGLPEEALIHETAATSTMENARYVAPLLAKLHARSAILVTTWSHAPRAKKIFAREIPGVEFSVSFEPHPAVLNRWERHFQRRERFAAVHHLLVHGLWCF